LDLKRFQGLQQEGNVKAYLCTGIFDNLLNKPLQDIPFPDPIYLKNMLDDKLIRLILPPNINPITNNASFCNAFIN
jgi:hypothetical protein